MGGPAKAREDHEKDLNHLKQTLAELEERKFSSLEIEANDSKTQRGADINILNSTIADLSNQLTASQEDLSESRL